MVKSKKMSKKITKTEDALEVESPAEDIDIKFEDESEKTTQENGDVEVSVKKKGKGKASKKEEVESSGENASEDKPEEEIEKTTQENGEVVDISLKKKGKSHKAAKKEKPAEEPSRKSSRAPKPVSKEPEEEESYEVEKLVEFRLQRGKPQFLVRWKGYSKSDDTWEDEAGLNCPELLQKYKADHPDAGKTTKKRAASKSPAKSHKKKSTESNKDYEVEEIVGMRVKNGKKEFKIHWKGYKSSDDTWEPEKHLSCQDLIKEYIEEHGEDEAEEKKTPAKKAKTSAKSTKSRRTKAK